MQLKIKKNYICWERVYLDLGIHNVKSDSQVIILPRLSTHVHSCTFRNRKKYNDIAR